jgi:DNA polymerase-1
MSATTEATPADHPPPSFPSLPKHYETVLDHAALERWIARVEAAPLTALDTETDSLEPLCARLVGLSLCCEPGVAAYVPLAHDYPGVPPHLSRDEVLHKLRPWLESPAHAKVGQNLKYDMHVFANHGITLRGIQHDTLLESYVLESDKTHNMEALALRHLGLKTISYEAITGKGAQQLRFDQVDIETASEYAAEDADITQRLHHNLHPQVADIPALESLYREIELPVMQVLFNMERRGVLIDCAQLAEQSHALGVRMLEVEREAHQLARQPFNLMSPKQIQEILFEREGLPVLKKTPAGAPSTDEEVLQQLSQDYPLPKRILEYRSLSKLKGTYTDKLPRMVNAATGRVHTRFAQAVAVTGRLASSDPNLQNIPIRTPEGRRVRAAFIAPPGFVIMSADYSQIELRIMAHLSEDAGLLQAFAKGEDVHRATAAEIFGLPPAEVSSEQRRYAKVINFGLIYGMSSFGLARELGLERSAAQAYIDRYFARYPGVARYMETTREAARKNGFVETVFGRRLWLADIRSGNVSRRQGAERAAINAPMQGTAADLIKRAMIAVDGWLNEAKMRSRLVLQVHDELVLEVAEEELEGVRVRVPELMAGVAQLRVPLLSEVGVGANWDQAH